jgi:hypothetical protein
MAFGENLQDQRGQQQVHHEELWRKDGMEIG